METAVLLRLLLPSHDGHSSVTGQHNTSRYGCPTFLRDTWLKAAMLCGRSAICFLSWPSRCADIPGYCIIQVLVTRTTVETLTCHS